MFARSESDAKLPALGCPTGSGWAAVVDLPRTRSRSMDAVRAQTIRGEVLAVASAAEAEALRSGRVLAVLDLRRARACSTLARRARGLAASLLEGEGGREKRLADVLAYQDVVREAAALRL